MAGALHLPASRAARSPTPASHPPARPHRPALIQLHHYAWWHAVGDGEEQGGLFYYPAGEQQLGALAHYYDFPAVSVRAAMWHLMRPRVPGFNVRLPPRHRPAAMPLAPLPRLGR